MKTAVRIDVWSDYVCPFCYLELPVLSSVQEEMGDALQVAWRAFELRPEPVPTLDPDGAYLHRVWNDAVYPMARERGLELRLPPLQPRSRRALEAAEWARGAGRFDAMHLALFRAFFRDGRDLDDPFVLRSVAQSVRLDGAGLVRALETGAHTPKVLADERAAQELDLSGVPGMVVRRADGRGQAYRLSGALGEADLRKVIDRVSSENGPDETTGGDAPACA